MTLSLQRNQKDLYKNLGTLLCAFVALGTVIYLITHPEEHMRSELIMILYAAPIFIVMGMFWAWEQFSYLVAKPHKVDFDKQGLHLKYFNKKGFTIGVMSLVMSYSATICQRHPTTLSFISKMAHKLIWIRTSTGRREK